MDPVSESKEPSPRSQISDLYQHVVLAWGSLHVAKARPAMQCYRIFLHEASALIDDYGQGGLQTI